MSKPKRNYKKETAYENTPEQVARRVARNKARRLMEKKYGKAALKGKEVDHIKMNPGGKLSNSKKNLRVIPKSENRKKQPQHKGIYR